MYFAAFYLFLMLPFEYRDSRSGATQASLLRQFSSWVGIISYVSLTLKPATISDWNDSIIWNGDVGRF
jgi:hypothetical protein